MKRKAFAVVGIGLSTFIFLAVFSTALCAQESIKPIVLKCSTNAPRNMPVMLGIEVWGKEIEKSTNGRVKFEFYWAQSLLKAEDALKGTGKGIADVTNIVASYTPADLPLVGIFELGYITSQPDAVARALTDLYEEYPILKNEFERHNVKVMFFVPFPPNIMAFTKPVKTLEDLKGMKIRAVGILNQVVAKLGGTPVAISVAEVYESLNRKVIDGYTGNILSSVLGFKYYEVAPYHLDFGYGNYATFAIVFNRDRWESLPPDIRRIIGEVNSRAIDMYTTLYAKEEPTYVSPLKKAGCSFYTLTGDEFARWKNLIVPWLWNEWVERHKQYGPSKEFFDRYLELVKKYEVKSTYINPFPK
jgi:TRAP-type C4-dicarboxylate transport system substrate-binding protein